MSGAIHIYLPTQLGLRSAIIPQAATSAEEVLGTHTHDTACKSLMYMTADRQREAYITLYK